MVENENALKVFLTEEKRNGLSQFNYLLSAAIYCYWACWEMGTPNCIHTFTRYLCWSTIYHVGYFSCLLKNDTFLPPL
jgi:hypothetical protein